MLAEREATRRRRAAYDTTAAALVASGSAPPASELLALGRALQRFSQGDTNEDARRLAVMLQLVLQGMPPRAAASTSYFALALDKGACQSMATKRIDLDSLDLSLVFRLFTS